MPPDLSAAPRAAGANLVCFELRGQRFGCGIAHVKETITVRPITRVFLTPSWVSGLINLRGDIVAVLDLAAYLGLGATEIRPETRVLIARHRDKVAGLLVDKLAEVRAADLDGLEPVPPTASGEIAAVLAGVLTLPGGAPLGILDLTRLFDSERLRAFARRAHEGA
jgi:purine-binding chemotaxis protein CheW